MDNKSLASKGKSQTKKGKRGTPDITFWGPFLNQTMSVITFFGFIVVEGRRVSAVFVFVFALVLA